MKQIAYIVLSALLMFTCVSPVHASEKEAGSTATLSGSFGDMLVDKRLVQLSNYLESVNSPMADSAEHFIHEADRLDLDWKLVVAISGVESYFGRRVPQNSYNAWGWAIFTGRSSGKYFKSWNDGITVVSEGLKEKYVNRGLDTVEKMGYVYAADPTWAWKVNHFIEKIASYQPRSTSELAIAL
jgi:hypothetical protein